MGAPTAGSGLVLAVDAGTTGVRVMAIDQAGQPAAWSYREFPQLFPRPGWVEHDPEQIWEAVQASLADVVAATNRPVAAVGVTNQRETAVAWDRSTGRPLHSAIVWQDRRTADQCRQLEEAGHLPLVRRSTGLVLDPYFSATKFAWLLNEGGVQESADLALGTVDSWLVWKLTGGAVHVTDPSNASRTLLYDIGAARWSDELCNLFGVPPSALPEVRPSSGRVGTTTADLPLGQGVPVSAMVGDQQGALFGQACFQPGMAKNTYGTGSFVLVNAGPVPPEEPVEGLLTTVAWQLDEGGPLTYALEGAIFVTGAAIQWLRDGLGIVAEAAEIGPLAESQRDNEGVYLVPAFTGLGSPWWDPHARGTLVGVTRGVGRAHLARAAVEAMAYQTRDVVDAMTTAGRPLTELRVDGGASTMDVLLQLQADQLRVRVARPVLHETTALGAAWMAGLAEGVWSTTQELAATWRLEAEFLPRASTGSADARHAGWRRAVERARQFPAR